MRRPRRWTTPKPTPHKVACSHPPTPAPSMARSSCPPLLSRPSSRSSNTHRQWWWLRRHRRWRQRRHRRSSLHVALPAAPSRRRLSRAVAHAPQGALVQACSALSCARGGVRGSRVDVPRWPLPSKCNWTVSQKHLRGGRASFAPHRICTPVSPPPPLLLPRPLQPQRVQQPSCSAPSRRMRLGLLPGACRCASIRSRRRSCRRYWHARRCSHATSRHSLCVCARGCVQRRGATKIATVSKTRS